MAGLFNLAADRALHMSQPPPPKISIAIEIGQPPGGGGGLSSIQKRMNIGGEPHRLSYINSDEASLLKQLGGSGLPINGVPAYFWDVGDDPSGEGWDAGEDRSEDDSVDEGGGYSAAVKEGMTQEEADQAQRDAAAWDYEFSQVAAEDKDPGFFEDLWSAMTVDKNPRGIAAFMADKFGITPKDITEFGVKEIGGGILGVLAGPLGYFVGRNLPAITKALGLEELSPEEYAKQEKEQEEMAQLDTGLPEETKIKKILDVGEEEEEEGRWDKYYEDREDSDPYKGSEKTLEDIYGPNWREILERGVY